MSSESVQTATVSGLPLLIQWANRQDHWIRKLVVEVIATRQRLLDERIDALHDLLLREKKLAEGDPVNVEHLADAAILTPAGTTIRLVSLQHIAGVNALEPDQKIEFHPRITICFGENASGKTGYVRILKCVAAVRTAELVLSNIHASTPVGTPQARIKVLVAEKERLVEWQGQLEVEPLIRIDIFDARTTVVHLAEDLTFSYTPAELSLFPLVADAIERVQVNLQAAIEERQPRTNPFVNRFPSESHIYTKIEGLGLTTDLGELEELAQVSEEEETALQGLREKVGALRSGSVRGQLEQAKREHTVLAQVAKTAETILTFDRNAYGEAVLVLRSAQANHERATREALSGEDVPGILSDAWKDFIEAAEGYIQEIGLNPYPAPGERCIYCRQPLGDAAVSLLRKYREFCNDALRRAVEEAQGQVQKLSSYAELLSLQDIQRGISDLVQALENPNRPPSALVVAQKVIEYAKAVQDALGCVDNCPAMPEDLRDAQTILRATVKTAECTMADLRKQGEERECVLADEQARLHELEARLTLREAMLDIRGYVESAIWADCAQTYLGRFQGIKRALTDTSKRASNEVVNRDFKRRFDEECKALHAPHVTLEFPGREGETRRRKILTPNHGLEEILSEGEQKVIALADFLAEASLKPDRSPLVFDDPVTSLDHKRLCHVVDRIVELSRDRQVIVFTHDILFVAEFLARFEREHNECEFYDITAESQRIGLVTRGSYPRTDDFNDRKRRIIKVIKDAEKGSGEARHALIEKGYEELRGTCEIVVEKDLLRGVIERYRPNIRVTSLGQIRSDRLSDAVKKIVPIFEKCCRIIPSHSQPLTTRGIRPTLDELKDDWTSLNDARKEYLR